MSRNSGNVFVIGERTRDETASIVDDDVIGLSVGLEFVTLQVAPFVAIGLKGDFLAVFLDYHGLGQVAFLVNHEFDDYKVVVDHVVDAFVVEHGAFHLAAVDTSVSREVDENRFAFLSCHAHRG